MRQHLRLSSTQGRKAGLQDPGNPHVELPAGASEHRSIGRVLYQGMLKDIVRLGGLVASKQQLSLDELVQRCSQFHMIYRGYSSEYVVGKFPAKSRPDLGHLSYWR